MQLRSLLRATLQPSEHIVGWGTATRATPTFETLIFSFMMAAPFLAGVFFALLSTRKRVLVLTDRRLLVIACAINAEQPAPKHITFNEPLHQLHLTRQGKRAFRIYIPDRPGKPNAARAFTLARSKAHTAKALAQGLALIAQPQDNHPIHPQAATSPPHAI